MLANYCARPTVSTGSVFIKRPNPVRRQNTVPGVNGKIARGMLGIGIVVSVNGTDRLEN